MNNGKPSNSHTWTIFGLSCALGIAATMIGALVTPNGEWRFLPFVVAVLGRMALHLKADNERGTFFWITHAWTSFLTGTTVTLAVMAGWSAGTQSAAAKDAVLFSTLFTVITVGTIFVIIDHLKGPCTTQD